MISDYVVFLLQSSVPNFNLQNMIIDAEAEEISTIQSPEDFLVYSCLLAHKISNNEQINCVKIPDIDQIKMQRAKIVLAFLSLLDWFSEPKQSQIYGKSKEIVERGFQIHSEFSFEL